jgi:hypothetical protein
MYYMEKPDEMTQLYKMHSKTLEIINQMLAVISFKLLKVDVIPSAFQCFINFLQ